ncbi:AraC family transcriptional regulator [Pseudomonas sp. URMO17WK12:I12]|uniref:AraC family transcriptional regulator n=1 Tax=Pseudomonas sp. URMO17WK12:I12 TaxID=1259797 RepID=UPI0004BA38F9|nr:AraC family transcriptional regulator [Pseudomonas sp. URMO17WK12:I12]
MQTMPTNPATAARTTLASIARAIAKTLKSQYDIDPLPMLTGLGFDPAILHDNELRLDLTDITPLWLRAVELSGDANFGLCVARNLGPADLYGIDLALYTSATIGDAVRRYVLFLPLITTVTRMRLVQDESGDWRMETRLTGVRVPADAARDCFNYHNVKLFERQSGLKAPQFLRRLEIPRPQPSDPTPWLKLGIAVLFGQECATLVFKRETWDSPLPGANARWLARVEQPILQHLARLGAPLPLSALRAGLAEILGQEVSAQHLANTLALPVDCVTSSLIAQNTTFAQLLDQTREAQSLNLLAMPDLTLDQIASRAGFSSKSSLIRAFRRWKGTTPLSYRKQLD